MTLTSCGSTCLRVHHGQAGRESGADPLDPTALDVLTGTDPDATRALVDDFLASTADDRAALASARASTAWVQLAGAAGQLEAAGRAEERPALAALAADVATAADRLRLCAAERYPG